ncbi:hypothetical protein BVI434_3520001 [Burkholderia vietnamiensis]|nr:hypothetical protein BVI434_3520001 [Burkholderia vietnamiensis]
MRGAYRLLHDEALWDALTPLLEGLKVFAQGLEREPPDPASAAARVSATREGR